MEKTEIQAVIKYFIKKGIKANEIHAGFQNTVRDPAPSYLTVAKWSSEFKFSRESLGDNPHGGWPKSATTPEFIAEVPKKFMCEWLLKL